MEIGQLNESNVNDIIHLSNEAFGNGFINKNHILKSINSNKKISLLATDNKVFTGYLLAEILPFKKFINEILSEKEWFLENFNNNNTVCFIKQLAVDKQHQRKGIARKLIKDCLNQSENVELVCCIAWKKHGKPGLESSLLNNYFTSEKTIKNYWFDDSLMRKYNCAFCGTPPCNCNAEVYIKKM